MVLREANTSTKLYARNVDGAGMRKASLKQPCIEFYRRSERERGQGNTRHQQRNTEQTVGRVSSEEHRTGGRPPGADRVVVQVHLVNIGLGEPQSLAVRVGELGLVWPHQPKPAGKERQAARQAGRQAGKYTTDGVSWVAMKNLKWFSMQRGGQHAFWFSQALKVADTQNNHSCGDRWWCLSLFYYCYASGSSCMWHDR